jgi:hypothetical protein
MSTPQIREALAKLEDAEVALDRAILDAKQVEQQVPKTQLSEEDIRQIEEHARGADAPRELRELQRRIDAGELSWEDIASGRHLDDPSVQAALSPGTDGMHQAYTMIQEGQDLDEIIESPPAVRQTDARDDTDDDDDPDDEGPVFRGVY